MAMPFAVKAFIMLIVSYALQTLTQPKPRSTRPDAGSVDVPLAQEGDSLSVLFGTDMIKDPHIIWSGNASTTPIKTKSGGK